LSYRRICQKSNAQTKLFPVKQRDIRNKFSNFSKKFARYRDDVGAGPRKDKEFRNFHSFRHLVRTELESLGVESGLIDDIIGHTSADRSMENRVYSHSDLIKVKSDAIKK
jgi:integrase